MVEALDRLGERKAVVLVILIGAVLLTYLPLYTLPYLLLDDNWIIRSHDGPGRYPDLVRVVALQQGRPVFMALLHGTRTIARWYGLDTMSYVRLGATLLMGLFAYLLQRWLCNFGLRSWPATAYALAAVTLPAFQMYLGGGPWLTLGIVMAAAAMHLLYEAAYRGPATRGATVALCGAAAIFLMAAVALYQPTMLVAFSFLLLPLLNMNLTGPRKPGELRFLLYAAGIIFVSLLIYYVSWRTAYGFWVGDYSEHRYNPTALLTPKEFAPRLALFWEKRLPQNMNLWIISWRLSWLYYLTAGIILGGIGANVVRIVREQRSLGRAVLDTVAKVIGGTALVLLSDTFGFASSQPLTSFVTTAGLSLTTLLLVVWALRNLGHCLPVEVQVARLWRHGVLAGTIAVAVLGAATAQASVTKRLAMPLWLEISLSQDRVRQYLLTHRDIARVVVHIRPVNLAHSGTAEFVWTNFGLSCYSYWFTRNILDAMGVDSNIPIDVVHDSSGTWFKHPGLRPAPEDCEPLEIDLFHLNIDRQSRPAPVHQRQHTSAAGIISQARPEPGAAVPSAPRAAEKGIGLIQKR